MFQVFVQGFIWGVAITTLLHFWVIPYIIKRKEIREKKEILDESIFDRAVDSIQKEITRTWLHHDVLTPGMIQHICDLTVFKFSADISTVHEGDEYLIWVKSGKFTKKISGSFSIPPKELAKFKKQEFNKTPIL